MWVVLGVIGSIVMVVLEAIHTTDIGYWWAAVPTVLGILFQIGLADLIFGIFD